MGEVIRKSAAVDDILRDAQLTMKAAAARGPNWSLDAEQILGPTLALVAKVTAELATANDALPALKAMVDVRDDEADDLLAATYDAIYNKVGRPGYDPLLTLLFPGGSSAYTQGSDDEQPERMELLAELLAGNLHPGLPEADAAEAAQQIRASAARLREALEAARRPRVRVGHLSALRTVLARSAQVQLGRLKNKWKGMGRSEADIHQVIPDRPRPRPKGASGNEPGDGTNAGG